MGTVQEFRNQVWNNANSNGAWTPVQGSSGWPVVMNSSTPNVLLKSSQKQHPNYQQQQFNQLQLQQLQLQQMQQQQQQQQQMNKMGSSTLSPNSASFQWSNSWEPVVVPNSSSPQGKQKKSNMNVGTVVPNTTQNKKEKSKPQVLTNPNNGLINGANNLTYEVLEPSSFHMHQFHPSQQQMHQQQQYNQQMLQQQQYNQLFQQQQQQPLNLLQQQQQLQMLQHLQQQQEYQDSINGGMADDLSSSEEEDDPSDPTGFGKKKKKTPEEKQLIEEELSKQNLYKTELCRSFCETGSCRYGHKCQFAHGEHEIRPVMRHPKYKTEICKTFSNTATCPYGNRCRFIHPGVTWGTSWGDDDGTLDLINAVDQLSLNSQQMIPSQYLNQQQMQLQQQMQQQMQMPMMSPISMPITIPMNSTIANNGGNAIKSSSPITILPTATNVVIGATNTVAPVGSPSTRTETPSPNPNSNSIAVTKPKTFIDLKDKEADVKKLVDEEDDETDSKPRLAFFQNLTVLQDLKIDPDPIYRYDRLRSLTNATNLPTLEC